MGADNVIALVLAVVLTIYLVAAFLAPDKF